MVAFPLEIIESIIDFLAASYSSTSSIKACSLVSHSLLPRARTHLFASIKINGNFWGPPQPTPLMFSRLIAHTPEIAYYVTSLSYNVKEKDLAAAGFATALGALTSLKRFTLESSIIWKDLPFREVILNLMHLPTLSHLKLAVKGFYLSDLALCTGLKSLEGYSDAAERGRDIEMVQERPSRLEHFVERSNDNSFLQLCTTYRTDGKPVVDISGLKTLSLIVEDVEFDEITPWFGTCTQLTDVDLHDCETLLMQGSLANLFLPSIRTLKHICMSFTVPDDDEDLFLSLFSGFRCLADGNVIESIEIVFQWYTDTHGDEWGALEVFNPSESSWKALRKLSLHIKVFVNQDRYDGQKVLKNLVQLPDTQLRSLARSGITFVFEVYDYQMGTI